jgi:hypothetical protein
MAKILNIDFYYIVYVINFGRNVEILKLIRQSRLIDYQIAG